MKIKELQQQLNEQFKNRKNIYEIYGEDAFFKAINEYQIPLRKKDIITLYMFLYNINDLDDYFYYRDQDLWEELDRRKVWFNSDALSYFIDKIVKEYYNVYALGDPSVIQDCIWNVNYDNTETILKSVKHYIRLLINYGKRSKKYELEEVLDSIDINKHLFQDLSLCEYIDEELYLLHDELSSYFVDIEPLKFD